MINEDKHRMIRYHAMSCHTYILCTRDRSSSRLCTLESRRGVCRRNHPSSIIHVGSSGLFWHLTDWQSKKSFENFFTQISRDRRRPTLPTTPLCILPYSACTPFSYSSLTSQGDLRYKPRKRAQERIDPRRGKEALIFSSSESTSIFSNFEPPRYWVHWHKNAWKCYDNSSKAQIKEK